jgi:two-component system sensor histidine kinase BaeS
MNWFKSSQFRVSLFFLAGVMVLFGILGFIVVQQGQRTFQTTVHGIQVQGGSGGIVFFQQSPDILEQRITDDNGDLRKPEDLFVQRFENSLLWISLLGVGIALLLGVFISEFFLVKPLSRLQKGIKGLRQREFKNEIEHTGLPEFDEVAASFNELAHELERVETLRRDLISDTSHELKTPLTALQVQLEGMRDGLIALDKKRVGVLLENVERLNDLTERLQEYARVRNRTATLDMKPIKLRTLLEKLVTDEVPVRIEVSSSVTVTGDKKLLEQVFGNLLRNAVIHAQASEVVISASDDKIVFADNGKGVPAEALPHLFERFFRVEGSRNRAHGGLGLGLAIVQEIVEAHGWSIEARANDPHGLKLTITAKS